MLRKVTVLQFDLRIKSGEFALQNNNHESIECSIFRPNRTFHVVVILFVFTDLWFSFFTIKNAK